MCKTMKSEQTIVNHSRPIMWVYIVFILIMLGHGIYVYFKEGTTGMLIQYLIPSVLLFVFFLRKYIDLRPLLIISDKGLKLRNKDWISWSDVNEVELKTKGRGKTVSRKLIIDYKTKESEKTIEEFQVNYLNLKGVEIKRIIDQYLY